MIEPDETRDRLAWALRALEGAMTSRTRSRSSPATMADATPPRGPRGRSSRSTSRSATASPPAPAAQPGEAWPERLAAGLRAHNPSLAFRNLAVEGATSAEVLEQLPEAIELEPDLVTVVCGANDVLRVDPSRRRAPTPAAWARSSAACSARTRRCALVTATSPERWDFLELGPRTRARVERGIRRANRATRVVADAYRVPYLEVAGHPGLCEPENFSADGLHPSPLGHRRAARGFAELIRERCRIPISIEGGTT